MIIFVVVDNFCMNIFDIKIKYARRQRNIILWYDVAADEEPTSHYRRTRNCTEVWMYCTVVRGSDWRILYYYCLPYVNMQHVVGRRRRIFTVYTTVRFRWVASCIFYRALAAPDTVSSHRWYTERSRAQTRTSMALYRLYGNLEHVSTINKITIGMLSHDYISMYIHNNNILYYCIPTWCEVGHARWQCFR